MHPVVEPIGSRRYTVLACISITRDLELSFIRTGLPPFRGLWSMRRALCNRGSGQRDCESRHAVGEQRIRADRTGKAFVARVKTREDVRQEGEAGSYVYRACSVSGRTTSRV